MGIFGGDEREIYPHLATAKALPSLVLAQMPLRPENRKRYQPSYAVIEWNDDIAGRQQAAFEFPGLRLGSMKADYLKILQMVPTGPYAGSRSEQAKEVFTGASAVSISVPGVWKSTTRRWPRRSRERPCRTRRGATSCSRTQGRSWPP